MDVLAPPPPRQPCFRPLQNERKVQQSIIFVLFDFSGGCKQGVKYAVSCQIEGVFFLDHDHLWILGFENEDLSGGL